MGLKREYPAWGAPKIRERLRRKYPDLRCADSSNAGGAVATNRGARCSRGRSAHEPWCADFKGEFQRADRRYCYPLTITDFATRYLSVFTVFERTFQELGMPAAIRTDNGQPVGCGKRSMV